MNKSLCTMIDWFVNKACRFLSFSVLKIQHKTFHFIGNNNETKKSVFTRKKVPTLRLHPVVDRPA